MATNAEIVEAYQQKDALELSAGELEATIAAAEKQLKEVKEKLALARRVDEVVDGVPVSVMSDTERFFDMVTLAAGPRVPYRSVHAYAKVGSRENQAWAVLVYERIDGYDRFHGGQALGLTAGWTQNKAMDVARRWLKGDDTVLDGEGLRH
jgi:hypothetical protein